MIKKIDIKIPDDNICAAYDSFPYPGSVKMFCKFISLKGSGYGNCSYFGRLIYSKATEYEGSFHWHGLGTESGVTEYKAYREYYHKCKQCEKKFKREPTT